MASESEVVQDRYSLPMPAVVAQVAGESSSKKSSRTHEDGFSRVGEDPGGLVRLYRGLFNGRTREATIGGSEQGKGRLESAH